MEVPSTLEDMETYCHRVLLLLERWNWLYKDRATEILLTDALSSEYLKILEILDDESLNLLPSGVTKENWPSELVHFIKECEHLTFIIPNCQNEYTQLEVPVKLKKCTSLKKEHEINQLAGFVVKHCSENNVSRVYDIGSGLGYIDRVLATFTGLPIVGVELDDIKITTALKLNKELMDPDKVPNVTYIQCKLEEKSLGHLCEELKLYNGNSCLIGLHACGDLSTTTLRLFLKVDKITSLILIPCCYHKISRNKYFPISNMLKKKLSENKGNLINTTFLRLASESTKERWTIQSEESHFAHAFSVLSRAVIESFITEHKYKTERRGRRCVTKQHNMKWSSYVSIWLDRHIITNENGIEVCKKRLFIDLLGYWTKYSNLLHRIKAYTCLQVCLQSVAERLVLIDRLSFLLENGHLSATAIRISNPILSPRSIAIFATKTL